MTKRDGGAERGTGHDGQRARRRRQPARHKVVALCLPGTVAFDLTAPAQAFALAAAVDGTPHYAFSTCSLDGAPVTTTSGFTIGVEAEIEVTAEADTVVVPGYFGVFAP